MTLEHKAFEFDWEQFSGELRSAFVWALENDDATELREFVNQYTSICKSPYDGIALPTNWAQLLENDDTQEIADFALTKYYDPSEGKGLGQRWLQLERSMSNACRQALLGRPIDTFDPGRLGSYFQSPADVLQSIRSPGATFQFGSRRISKVFAASLGKPQTWALCHILGPTTR